MIEQLKERWKASRWGRCGRGCLALGLFQCLDRDVYQI